MFKDLISELKNNSVVNVFLRHPILRLKNIIVSKRLFRKIILSAFVTAVLIIRLKKIRCIKDESEIKKIAKAQEITEKSYLEVLNYLKPGVSERRVAL